MNGFLNVNWRIIWNIAVKDWKEIRQNRMAWLPALLVPLIFTLGAPLLILTLANLPEAGMGTSDTQALLLLMPPAITEQLAGLTGEQATIVLLLGYIYAPLFLIVPLMVASVFGADSIVGEKERKTLEALLYTPATDRELYLAKLLSSVVPAIALSWGSFILYSIVLNVAGAPLMGRVWFPLPHWFPLILWVSPAVATLGMSVIVLVSSRVSSFTEAQQTSGLLALPIVALVVGQASGVLNLTVGVLLGIGTLIWLLDAALIWLGVKQFSRSALISRI